MAYEDKGPGPKLWTIFDPRLGLFWRSGGCGYTSSVTEAGLFSEEFAQRMTGPAYAGRNEQARHLKTFRYIIREHRKRLDELEARFALLESPDRSEGVEP